MVDQHTPPLPGAITLGQHTDYPQQYAPELLCPIPRAPARDALGITDALPFSGEDRWTGYEISWLNASGKPQVAMGMFILPADSPAMVESKSFKLYLNSLNQAVFKGQAELQACLVRDLSRVVGMAVQVELQSLEASLAPAFIVAEPLDGECLDTLDVAIEHYQPAPELLHLSDNTKNGPIHELLYSHLLKSNCPVTGQPDWATVFIEYYGEAIDRAGLLRYIISFREHQGFHENCVERLFMDISRCCAPQQLCVYARYTRRGGLDINPLRSSLSGERLFSHSMRRIARQ